MKRSGTLRCAAASLLVWVTPALSVEANAPYEQTVQYALENLLSGSSTAAEVDGSRFIVMPVRTWKSVSGHYCRQFELTVERTGAAANREEGLRCRDNDGNWKQLKRN